VDEQVGCRQMARANCYLKKQNTYRSISLYAWPPTTFRSRRRLFMAVVVATADRAYRREVLLSNKISPWRYIAVSWS